ncbi:unnamed protein product [Durusdinium trenchii]|uniref:Translocation protein SEC62 n=1 Tax=Durusdinium trenchii TaxID=1381693 RepID=A0ABP0KP50_9DINO
MELDEEYGLEDFGLSEEVKSEGEDGESEERTDDELDGEENDRKQEDGEEDIRSVSSVSNEGNDSDDDEMPEITRGAAQVFPEESWRRPLQRLQALLLSCLLPILLALLVVFAAFRLVKLFFQLLNDVYIVVRYVVLLAIRIALFPFYLLWLLLPSFIQDFLWENYEQRFGHRVRAVLSVKHAVEETISDVPDMLWACLVALYYSCVQPIGQTCRQLAWRLCGRMLVNTVFDPLHDAQVNKASWSKRKFIDGRGNKKRPVASQAVMASAHLRRAKAQAVRAKARRQRARRRRDLIRLALPEHQRKHLKQEDHFVQLEEHNPLKMKSRVMIVERRYAVFVGFAWMIAGQTILVLTLTGSDGDRCTICSEVPSLGMKMCQLGVGRDCAFENNSTQIVASVVLIGVGMLLAIYATCLYRPRSKSSEAIAEEEALAKKHYEALASRLKKTEDLESQVFGMLEDHFEKPSCAKNLRDCYYASPLGFLQHILDSCGYAWLVPVLRCEERWRLRAKSLWLQELCIFLSVGWIISLCGKVRRCFTKLRERKARRKSEAEASAPRCAALQQLLQRCYVWRAFLYWTGLGFSQSDSFDTKLVHSAKRSDARGVRSLEETLAHFDLIKPEEDPKDLKGVMELLLEEGYEELPLEAGFSGT